GSEAAREAGAPGGGTVVVLWRTCSPAKASGGDSLPAMSAGRSSAARRVARPVGRSERKRPMTASRASATRAAMWRRLSLLLAGANEVQATPVVSCLVLVSTAAPPTVAPDRLAS